MFSRRFLWLLVRFELASCSCATLSRKVFSSRKASDGLIGGLVQKFRTRDVSTCRVYIEV